MATPDGKNGSNFAANALDDVARVHQITLVDEGDRNVSDAFVFDDSATGPLGSTDANGRIDVEAKNRRLKFLHERFKPLAVDMADDGSQAQLIRIRLQSGSRISGSVVDQDGAPVPDLDLVVRRGSPSREESASDPMGARAFDQVGGARTYSRRATTDSAGGFRIEGLDEGAHVLSVDGVAYALEGGADGATVSVPTHGAVWKVARIYVAALEFVPEPEPEAVRSTISSLSFPLSFPEGLKALEPMEADLSLRVRGLVLSRNGGRTARILAAKAMDGSGIPRDVALEVDVPISVIGSMPTILPLRFVPVDSWRAEYASPVDLGSSRVAWSRITVRAPIEVLLWSRAGGFLGAPYYGVGVGVEEQSTQEFLTPSGVYEIRPRFPWLMDVENFRSTLTVGASETHEVDLRDRSAPRRITIEVRDAVGRPTNQYILMLARGPSECAIHGTEHPGGLTIPAGSGEVRITLFDRSGVKADEVVLPASETSHEVRQMLRFPLK